MFLSFEAELVKFLALFIILFYLRGYRYILCLNKSRWNTLACCGHHPSTAALHDAAARKRRPIKWLAVLSGAAQHSAGGKKSTFPPPTFTKVRFSSLNSKTGQITSLNFSNRAFYLPGAVSKAVLLQ
jgi:hypothetical protein